MIKIIIADDHNIVRQGLKQILSETNDMVVAGEASNGNELLEKINTEEWNLVILDISMPGRNGLEIISEIKANYPELPVLILTIHPEEQYALRYLKAGAAGYLTKETASKELVDAIRKVCSGGRYVSPQLGEHLALALDKTTKIDSHEQLSNREYQVLELLGSGKSTGEIANKLFLSEKTISTYRRRILVKLHLKNTAQIIKYAIEHGLAKYS